LITGRAPADTPSARGPGDTHPVIDVTGDDGTDDDGGSSGLLDDEDVATRLALLCLQRDGTVAVSRWAAAAVRGGALVDLVRAGRLAEEDDAVVLRPGPGVGAVAEALARDAEAEERPLADLVHDGRPGLGTATGDAVDRGLWVPRPSPVPWRRGRLRAAEARLSRAALVPVVARWASTATAADGRPPRPDRAATAAIAMAGGLLHGRFDDPDDALLAACGPLEWVTRSAVEALTAGRQWHGVVERTTITDLRMPG
jgi:hypothetical protein